MNLTQCVRKLPKLFRSFLKHNVGFGWPVHGKLTGQGVFLQCFGNCLRIHKALFVKHFHNGKKDVVVDAQVFHVGRVLREGGGCANPHCNGTAMRDRV